MRKTACLVFNPIMVECYAALFSCMAVVQASDSMTASNEARNSWLKPDDCLWLDPLRFNLWFSLALTRSVGVLAMSPLHCFIKVF